MVPTVPPRDVNHLCLRCLITVVAPIDMKARAIEMGKAGCKPQAFGCCHRNETVEFSDPIAIERIQGPTEGIVVELVGRHTERNQEGGGLVLEEARHEVEGLVNKAQTVEHHGFDRLTDREVSHFWVV